MINRAIRRTLISIFSVFLMGLALVGCGETQEDTSLAFPSVQPVGGNFNKPVNGEVLDVTPPGFCWWRAGDKGEVSYLVQIYAEDGSIINTSPWLDDPAYIPSSVLAPGKYTWTVEALDAKGKVVDVREESQFVISEGAAQLPWIDPAELLSRVPSTHPRLLFNQESLIELRKDIKTRLKEPYEGIKRSADRALGYPLMEKSLYDTLNGEELYPARRTAYQQGFHDLGETYQGGVVPMALTYLISQDKKYGEAVKRHLLNLCSWSLDGSMQVQDSHFDEHGLTLARVLPQAYDWTYDLFSPGERLMMENWMASLVDSFLFHLETTDFLNYPGESHAGRLPAYFMEFCIVMADRPEAVAWMEYAMKSALTVWPHWAGSNGGWAEGISYSLGYNGRYLTPLQSVWTSTGYNLWQKPFFSKFPYFLTYCVSPVGEMMPFGDSEHQAVEGRIDNLQSLLLYYSHVFENPGMRWWVDLLEEGKRDGRVDPFLNLVKLLVSDDIKAEKPDLPPDRAFMGIGWAAFHSDITNPSDDLMMLFKSSPYGPASHSHADQNSFVIMKGGKALAIPGGERYPQHGSPFHTEYVRLTEAHNTLLINGKGQAPRDPLASGKIFDFKSSPHIGYAAGEAQLCYGPPVESFIRHAVMIRPSLILMVDEVVCSEPSAIDWLLHGKEKFRLDAENQQLTSVRGDVSMNIRLMADAGFEFSQTDEWPVDPKKDYPMITSEPPPRQWHFKAKLLSFAQESVIAAVMSVESGSGYPRVETIERDSGITKVISALFEGGERAEILINLGRDPESKARPLIEIRYYPAEGEMEELIIK